MSMTLLTFPFPQKVYPKNIDIMKLKVSCWRYV